MVLVKNSNFLSTVFFGQIKPEQIVFGKSGYITTFLRPEKWSFKKAPKMKLPKGLVHCFCQEFELSGQIKPEKIVFG